jgi:hypothetical protein
MITLHEEYLVDEAGNRKAVVLPLAAWRQIQEELEELEAIRVYDEAKAQPSEPIPFEERSGRADGIAPVSPPTPPDMRFSASGG